MSDNNFHAQYPIDSGKTSAIPGDDDDGEMDGLVAAYDAATGQDFYTYEQALGAVPVPPDSEPAEDIIKRLRERLTQSSADMSDRIGARDEWHDAYDRAQSTIAALRAKLAETKDTIDEIWEAVDSVRYQPHSWEEAEAALQDVYIALAAYREGADAAAPAGAGTGRGD
jgi:hypothetical protein